MKKIIFLSISLLFSSVQAQELSEAEIIAELAENAEFVASVHTLCEQGLAPEQIVVQLVQAGEAQAYVMPEDQDYKQYTTKREQKLTPIEIILSLGVPLCILIIGLYFELQFQK